MYNITMKKFICWFLAFFLFASLTACKDIRRSKIAYSVYPIEFLLKRLAMDKVEIVSIQDDRIIQVAKPLNNFDQILKSSQYYFHIGDLEPYHKLYEKDIVESGVKVIDLSSLNAIYNFKRYTPVYAENKEAFIESPYYDHEAFKEIDVLDKDLYLWLDPIGMISMAKDILNVLSSNYVEQSVFFNENYKKLQEELINLDAEFQKLAHKIKNENKNIKFVSMSNSFGNWQKAFGIQVYPVFLSKYGALPSDEQLKVIKDKIKADEVKYIAYEENMSPEMKKLFNKLEAELRLERVNLSNLSSLTLAQKNASKDYLSIMYDNLFTLESMISQNSKTDNTTSSKVNVANKGQTNKKN